MLESHHTKSILHILVEKNTIIAIMMGEAPLERENPHRKRYDPKNTNIPMRNPITNAKSDTRKNPTISTFGGPRTSSVLREILSRVF